MESGGPQFGRGQGGGDDGDPGIDQGAPGGFEDRIRQRVEFDSRLRRQDRRTFHWSRTRLKDRVPGTHPAGRQKAAVRGQSDHLSGDDRLDHRRGHLGVPADQDRPERVESLAHAREQPPELRFLGSGWQQDRGGEPARGDAGHGHVVGVDRHGVGAHVLARQRDRVGRDDQRSGRDLDRARVLPDAWPQ